MSDRRQPGRTSDAARWLAEGPARAPVGLLAHALDRTRRSGQRPGWLAIALGARDAAPASRVASRSALWVTAAALLLAAVLAVILVSGTPRPPLLVVAPTQSSLASGSPPGSPRPVPSQKVYDTDLGLTVTSGWLEPWAEVTAGWRGIGLSGAYDFRFDACPNGSCPAGVISVAVGDAPSGIPVDMQPGPGPTCPPDYAGDARACATWQAINEAEGGGGIGAMTVRISGGSMDELLAAWAARFGTQPELRLINGVRWAFGERPNRLVAFVVDGDRLVSVTAQPTIDSDQAGPTRARRLYSFLVGVSFDVAPAPWPTPDVRPVTTRWLDLTLTLPGWSTGVAGDRLTTIPPNAFPVGGPDLGFAIQRAPLDTTFVVNLGVRTGGGGQYTAEIGGATFGELAASIQREIVAGASPRESTVDGHRLLAWATPQRSIVGPLAWIAILEAGNDVYVFQEHYPLDAVFQAQHVEALLDGLRFVGKGSS